MTTEDRYTRVFARKLAELDRTVEGLSRAQQVTRTVLPTTSGPVGLEDMLENSVDVSEDVAVQREAISLLDEITSTSHDSWQGNEDSNFENAEGAHEAYMASIDAYAGVVVAQDEARAAVEEAANALTTANGKNARRRGVVQPLPPAGGWAQGDQWVRDVITGTPVEVARNVAENPRMVSAVSLPLDNLPGVIVTTKSVPLPAPLPGGIPVTTCLEGRIEGAGEGVFLLSVYGINGKVAGDSPNAGMGCYVYVTEPGYRVPAMLGWAETLLDAGVWTWCQTDGLLTDGAWTGLMVATVDGSTPSATARAYVTAVTQTPGGVPDEPFDGGYTLVPGTIPQWETESPNPVGESRLVTADVEATEVLVWNGTEFVHETLLTGELLVLGPGGIVRLADGVVTADAVAADAIDGKVITGATVRTAASGQRLQLDSLGLGAYNASGERVLNMETSSGRISIDGVSDSVPPPGATHDTFRALMGPFDDQAGYLPSPYEDPDNMALAVQYTNNNPYVGSGKANDTVGLFAENGYTTIKFSRYKINEPPSGLVGTQASIGFVPDSGLSIAADGFLDLSPASHLRMKTLMGDVNATGGNINLTSRSGDINLDPSNRLRSTRTLNALWTGALFMTDSQSISLPETVSSQLNGIVLEWSDYTGGSPTNAWWNYTHIPKASTGRGGGSIACPIQNALNMTYKIVNVTNTSIEGHSANNLSPRGRTVLRRVFGY